MKRRLTHPRITLQIDPHDNRDGYRCWLSENEQTSSPDTTRRNRRSNSLSNRCSRTFSRKRQAGSGFGRDAPVRFQQYGCDSMRQLRRTVREIRYGEPAVGRRVLGRQFGCASLFTNTGNRPRRRPLTHGEVQCDHTYSAESKRGQFTVTTHRTARERYNVGSSESRNGVDLICVRMNPLALEKEPL